MLTAAIASRRAVRPFTHVLIRALFVAVVAGSVAAGAQVAHAGSRARSKVARLDKKGMSSYDMLDYAHAKKFLKEALRVARHSGLAHDRVAARAHLHLAIVYFSGIGDPESAKDELTAAVKIDGSIDVPDAYKTADLERLLHKVKREVGGTGHGGGDENAGGGGGGGDCDTLIGLQHKLIDSTKAGVRRKVQARVSPNLNAARVSLFYRTKGAEDFTEVRMHKTGTCSYAADIPGHALHGKFLQYYVAALNRHGKAIASKGSAGSPNLIEIDSGGSGDDGGESADNENPLGGGDEHGDHDHGHDGDGGNIEKGAKHHGGGHDTIFVSLGLGTGGGYVSGTTEQAQNQVGCCFAPSVFHVFPEIGYYLSPRTTISAALRIGFVVGANISGHATGAPAAVVRLRHALSDDGNGLILSVAGGAGVIRNTVKLSGTNSMYAGKTDTTVSGPVLLGGGLGYQSQLGGPVKLVGELDALAGIPAIITQFGTCPGTGCVKPGFGLEFDLNLALLFAF